MGIDKCHQAVIGAGPAGIACARELRDEGHSVTVYEKGSSVGGTWVPENLSSITGSDEKKIHSSMYDSLRTNLPRETMSYIDFPFLPDCMGGRSVDSRMYPSHQEVRAYLEAYADFHNIYGIIEFEDEVTAVKLIDHDQNVPEQSQWEVTSLKKVRSFDAIAICNGHFTEPHIPEIPGASNFPGKQSHSHTYRNPNALEGRTVVILGTSASGLDISREIAGVAEVVYLSGRNHKIQPEMVGGRAVGSNNNIFLKPNIAQLKSSGGVLFDNGEEVPQVDEIIYCTGYEYSFPFLKTDNEISTKGQRVSPLYKHMFVPLYGPSLSFIGLNTHVIPFPIFEYQSKYLARLLSFKSSLPPKQEMEEDIKKFYNQLSNDGIDTRFTHLLGTAQFEYVDWLAAECGPDVQAFSPWRIAMFEEVRKMKQLYPEKYRDLWTHDDSLDAALMDLYERHHKITRSQAADKVQASGI